MPKESPDFGQQKGVRLHLDQQEVVDEVVDKSEMSLSGFIRNAVDHYLKEKQDEFGIEFDPDRIIH